MKKLFILDGKMTDFSSVLVVVITFGGILGTLFYQPPFWVGVVLISVSLLVGAIGIAAGASESVGAKPFTNDPLGWRKAKKSYKSDAGSDEVTKKDDHA
jgi:hypothetical protein